MEAVSTTGVAGWLAIHLAAIACAWATRLSFGSRIESALQLLFFTSLASVGLTAWSCQHREEGLWILSGLTLIGMVLTAVCDFRRTHEPHQAVPSASRR